MKSYYKIVGVEKVTSKEDTSKVFREDVNDITKINAYSKSFDFLSKEKDIYSLKVKDSRVRQ